MNTQLAAQRLNREQSIPQKLFTVVDEAHHFPARRFRGSAPMISAVRSALCKLRVALYGPALSPKGPAVTMILAPVLARGVPQVRPDIHSSVQMASWPIGLVNHAALEGFSGSVELAPL